MIAQRLYFWSIRHLSWLLSAVLIVVLIVNVPAFAYADYWFSLTHQHFAVAALALALTPVILTGGIDLSVGSVTLFASMVAGVCWQDLGFPLSLAFAAGILAGLAAGVVNGSLVSLGTPSLVATLATRELFRGLAVTISNGRTITFPYELNQAWEALYFGLPLPVYVLAFLFVLTYFVVHHTWMGRMLFAIGDNREAARFAAVPVKKIEFGCYAGVGLVAGLCGAVSVLHYSAARPDGEATLELMAIACVVLGGVRITGGHGHVSGTLFGVITLIMLLAGLQAIREWRDSIMGALLLVVALCNEAAAGYVAKYGHLQLAKGKSQWKIPKWQSK